MQRRYLLIEETISLLRLKVEILEAFDLIRPQPQELQQDESVLQRYRSVVDNYLSKIVIQDDKAL